MTAVLLFQVAAKVSVVLAAAWAATRAMGRCSAAARHLVWSLALAAALALPGVAIFGPVWALRVLPADTVATAAVPEVLDNARLDTGSGAGAERAPETAADGAPVSAGVAVAPGAIPIARAAGPLASLDWPRLLIQVWLAGLFLMLLRLVAGLAWARWIVATSQPVDDPRWQQQLATACAVIGVTSPVALRTTTRTSIPAASGVWKAAILLPPSAAGWSDERRQVVLQHELAHVRRGDCRVQALAQVACALHWFNPLAHLAVARLRAEQERACDDLVIESGTDARSYAHQLFEIARAYRASSLPVWATLSMARPSQLEGRVVAILDRARARRAPSLWVRGAVTAAMALAVLPVGTLQIAAAVAPAERQAWPIAPVDVATPVAASPERATPDAVEPLLHRAAPAVPLVEVPGIVGESLDHLVDAIPALSLDVREFLLSAAPALLGTKGRGSALPKELLGRANVRVFTDDIDHDGHRLEQSATQGAVSDETRRRVADALTTALGDENADVREEALSALANMRDERAIPGLIKALSDSNAEVRMRAIDTLVRFDTPAAADAVAGALKDANPEVRERAVRHMSGLMGRGQYRDPKYVAVFGALLKDENADVREQAVSALARMRTPEAAAPLAQALNDASPDVRETAARGLGQLRSADSVTPLVAALKDPATDVREAAAMALGSIADPRAIDALSAALKDGDADVREAAARALGQIARGQRRGVIPPPPPPPPRSPQAWTDFDADELRRMTEQARRDAEQWRRDAEQVRRDAERAAEEVRREVERQMRDFDPFPGWTDVPVPSPAPAPAPPPPPGR